MKNIEFSSDLSLPISVCTQKLAFLGISGSGKTYGAGKLVEGVIGAGAQVVVMDTIGNWYGLRLAADGNKPGISIPILGGAKGDVPLDSYGGRQAAELVVDSNASVIIDISEFTGGEIRRFVTEFATALLALKKRRPGPTLVVWEECQDIVPQRVMGETAHMVGAVEKLIKKGRNYGVGTVLISQRAAAVNKDVLNQIETLFVFRLNAKQDRKAIQDWIVDKDIDVGELVGELPRLPTGTCFCWSPQFLEVLKKVRVGKKHTFNASATPEFGEQIKAGVLVSVDLERFKKTMASAIEKAKANDPVELKKRLVEAEREAAKWKTLHAKQEDRVGIPPELEEIIVKLGDQIDLLGQQLKEINSSVATMARKVVSAKSSVRISPSPSRAAYIKDKIHIPLDDDQVRTVKQLINAVELGSGPKKMLQHLGGRHPDSLTRVQLATLSGFSHKSGTFATYISQLNTAGFIERVANGEVSFRASSAGMEWLNGDYFNVTGPELLDLWCSKLDGRAKDMLRIIVAAGDKGLSRDEVAEKVELSAGSGTFATYLSKLNSNGLITKHNGMFVATEDFR